MKKWMALFLLLLPGFSEAQAPADTLEHSLLWEISGHGLKSKSYLFGTIHIICPEDYFFPAYMEKKLKSADRLTLELDLDDPATLLGVQSGMFMKDGKKLSDLLPDSSFSKVEKFFLDSLNLPLSMYQNISPVMLASIVSQRLLKCSVKSYEEDLMERMKKAGKSVDGLETAADQLSALDSIPYSKQAEMLLITVNDFNQSRKEFQDMIRHYLAQEISQLLDEIHDSDTGVGSYEASLLTNRNRNWIPVMEKMMQEKSTFFAVGAGHLAGKDGLLHLLQQSGYTVKPVLK